MSLTQTQLDKLNKYEIIQYTLDIQVKYNENLNIAEKLEQAMMDITSIQRTVEELRHQNIQLEATLAVTKSVNDQLVKRVEDLERQTNANAQYSRRECLEISGIPKEVSNDDLEGKVRDILHEIDVNVPSECIEACHRLKSNNRTIIKFSNRKDCIKALSNRKKLKKVDKDKLGFSEDDKIYMNESLCPEYRFLFWKCRVLAGCNKIFSYWTYNGTIKITLSEGGKIYAITHVNDLKTLFPDIDFTKKVPE